VHADTHAPVVATGDIEVAADPETVWEVMADIQRWPSWNADITAATVHGPLQPGTRFSWKSGPGTIRSTLQVVERPAELAWTGRTMGIPAVHVYRLHASDQRPGHTVVRTEESWGGLLPRLFRRWSTRTLQTAIDTGLARLKAEAERRAAGEPARQTGEPSRVRQRRRWEDLSTRQRRSIVVAGVVQVLLAAAALLDLRRRPSEQVRGPKRLWAAAAALVNFVGPLAYFLVGRRRT
jgi:hypothetical protein